MSELQLERLEKRFTEPRLIAGARGEQFALKPLELTIRSREFFTFVGPSGSGKSTVLNLIAGLIPPSAGEIRFDGEAVHMLPPQKRDIAMVFQNYALYPHMSVFENIAFPLRLRKRSRQEIKQHVGQTAERLGLADLLERKPRELSGGQRQRTALARALVRRPRVFLMDEPLSNLDAGLRLEMRAELKRIHEEFGVTTVYVTHDQEEAMALSGRIAVMRAGCLEQCAPPVELYKKPANLFVAGFIGSPPMNILPASALAGSEALIEKCSGRPPDSLLAGIRPKDFDVRPKMCSSAPQNGQVEQPARVEVQGTALLIEPLGDSLWVTVQLEQTAVRAVLPADAQVSAGDRVILSADVKHVHVFDEKSGVSIR